MSTNNYIDCKGLVFIGDPHCAYDSPGRRLDNYFESCINKLKQARDFCNENDYYPIILGDLIHRNDESSNKLTSALIRVLGSFKHKPVELGGNHGKELFEYSDSDIETILELAGVIEIVNSKKSPKLFNIDGSLVCLHFCAHGEDLPEKVLTPKKHTGILISHHDLLFGDGYPGAKPLKEVAGASIAVNGHIHKTYPSVKVGATVWNCPGNIEPLSVDVRDHKPAIWVWVPDNALDLTPHYLSCNALFDLTGYQVKESSEKEALEDLTAKSSFFAKSLTEVAEETDDAVKTSDAEILKKDLEDILEQSNSSELVKTILKGLLIN